MIKKYTLKKSLMFLLPVIFLSCVPINSTIQNNSENTNIQSQNTKNYFSHIYRLSFDYNLSATIYNDLDIKNTDFTKLSKSFILINNYSEQNQDDIIRTIEEKANNSEVLKITAKKINYQLNEIKPKNSDIGFLVGNYPKTYPYSLVKPEAKYFVIAADKNNIERIISSLNFDVTPQKYINSFMDIVQNNSIMKNFVDWDKWRSELTNETSKVLKIEGTYTPIKNALKKLNDNHSSFYDKDYADSIAKGSDKDIGIDFLPYGNDYVIFVVFPDSPASRSGLKVGDIITSHKTNSDASIDLTIKRENTDKEINVHLVPELFNTNIEPSVKTINDIGYIELTGSTGNYAYQIYPNIVQDKIREIDQNNNLKGWIVDLRRNTGGATPPMLNAVGAILGSGDIGSRIDNNSKEYIWKYENGKVYYDNSIDSQLSTQPYNLKNNLPNVAVLMSNTTASAGEAVAIAFKGRKNTKFFGEETNGRTTGNETFIMSDGAWLNITNTVDADRNGNKYFSPVKPDIYVNTEWKNFLSEKDIVLNSAIDYLNQ